MPSASATRRRSTRNSSAGLGVLAELDETGRALPLAATFTGLGLALGPALAASVLTGGGYSPVLWLAAGLAIASVLLILPALRRAG
jgi:hypothetical protein